MKSASRNPKSALAQLDARLSERAVDAPRVGSFREFLEQHARVKITAGPDAGRYTSYTFAGREPLIEVCDTIDHVIGSHTGTPLKDSTIVLAGGAQFGKTVLELHLAAYLTACRFLSAGVYLPDDGLADAVVDAKFRPDVVDQIGWFARMTQVGKAVNKSGRAVNTKGAFLVTDGERKSVGMFRGLKKIPTTFSMDVVVRDEEDDIPRDKAKFLSGRMTASALRLQIIVGTQRVHGSGQNRQWEQGSQGVVEVQCPHCKKWWNPEDNFPGIVRVHHGSRITDHAPQLTFEGDFRRPAEPETVCATYEPDGHYFLGCLHCGHELDRQRLRWQHRRPERLPQRRWSYRISQLSCPAIDLSQIVAHWTRAVADSEEMVSFRCDRLADPKSTAQALTPAILDRARRVDPFEFGHHRPNTYVVGGLDTGDRCWLAIRDRAHSGDKRLVRADQIAVADVVQRTLALCAANNVGCLFIDERPAVTEARTLALILNQLDQLTHWPKVDWNAKDAYVSLPGGLTWDGRNQRWRNLRCAVVRFSKRNIGDGISHAAHEFDDGPHKKFVPLIECNRFETIDRAIRELLTPQENVIEVLDLGGKRSIRQTPALRMPLRKPGAPAILEALDSHLLTGSQRAKDEKTGELADYVDKTDNHLLLADAYAALAEQEGGVGRQVAPFAYTAVPTARETFDRHGGGSRRTVL
jgi:hypothetical protein